MRECCVGLNVGDESASLLVFSVCADGSVVWYFGCPGCWVELRFLYCDDVRLCCEQQMSKFFHGAPYAVCVELKNFYLFVFCFGGLLFVAGVGTHGGLCGGETWGESGRAGCTRPRV